MSFLGAQESLTAKQQTELHREMLPALEAQAEQAGKNTEAIGKMNAAEALPGVDGIGECKLRMEPSVFMRYWKHGWRPGDKADQKFMANRYPEMKAQYARKASVGSTRAYRDNFPL